MATSADPAGAIVAALAGAGTRLVFGVPGGGPNLDVIDAAVDPACYPAVMDLTRGQAGRRSVPAIHAKEHAQ